MTSAFDPVSLIFLALLAVFPMAYALTLYEEPTSLRSALKRRAQGVLSWLTIAAGFNLGSHGLRFEDWRWSTALCGVIGMTLGVGLDAYVIHRQDLRRRQGLL